MATMTQAFRTGPLSNRSDHNLLGPRTMGIGPLGHLGSALPLKKHRMTVGSWVMMAAARWAQTASPTGRLFEPGTRWSPVIAATIAILPTVAVHRNAVSTEIDRTNAARITTEQTDRLIRDLERVAELGVLKTPTQTRDAYSIPTLASTMEPRPQTCLGKTTASTSTCSNNQKTLGLMLSKMWLWATCSS